MKNKLKLIITKSAQDDIRGIVSYIALDNKTAALKFAKVIKNTFVYLSDYTNMGKKRPEYTDEDVLFFTTKWSYNIVYKLENGKLYVVRVLSEYQDCSLIF